MTAEIISRQLTIAIERLLYLASYRNIPQPTSVVVLFTVLELRSWLDNVVSGDLVVFHELRNLIVKELCPIKNRPFLS